MLDFWDFRRPRSRLPDKSIENTNLAENEEAANSRQLSPQCCAAKRFVSSICSAPHSITLDEANPLQMFSAQKIKRISHAWAKTLFGHELWCVNRYYWFCDSIFQSHFLEILLANLYDYDLLKCRATSTWSVHGNWSNRQARWIRSFHWFMNAKSRANVRGLHEI